MAQGEAERPVFRNIALLQPGDTAEYRYQHHLYRIQGNDTAALSSLVHDFRLVALDSLTDGTLLELTLLKTHPHPEKKDDLSGRLVSRFLTEEEGGKYLFFVDREGGVSHLFSWTDISRRFLSSALSPLPGPGSGIHPRRPSPAEADSIMHSALLQGGSERGLIQNVFRCIHVLFSANGIHFPLGWTSERLIRPDEGHFQAVETLFADRLAPSTTESGDEYGGIIASERKKEVIPLMTLIEGRGVAFWGERVLSSPLFALFIDHAVSRGEEAWLSLLTESTETFFLNSWPKEFFFSRQYSYIPEGRVKADFHLLEQDYLVWLRMKTYTKRPRH